jgi:HSP20 family protein
MIETPSIDAAIEQVERLYTSVTGHAAPTIADKPYAIIPPERIPEEHVQEQVDRLIQTLARFSETPATEPEWKPALAVWEARDEFRMVFDLPGVERDGVRVTVNQGMLEVSCSRPQTSDKDDGALQLRYAEHPFGKFRRLVPLPQGIKLDQLSAEIRDGVLEVRVPKSAEAVEGKTLTIK